MRCLFGGCSVRYTNCTDYKRFGFIPAETFGIGTPDNMCAEPLLTLELREQTRGRFLCLDNIVVH